jgi:uncharacterized membrane protein YfcA
MPDPSILYPLLFGTGLVAGLIDSISGGGGLLTLPVLLGIGLPPHLALGTNKLQSSFGSFTATYYYRRHNVVKIREALKGIIFTAIGTVIGTWSVQQIDSDFLGYLIPWMLLSIALYTFFSPKLGEKDQHPRVSQNLFYILFGLAFGFYDGFFGPGVGSFWAIAFVIMLGFSLTKATGYTKAMNFTSNIVSAVVFMIGGNASYTIGIVMALGQIIGSAIGARLVIRKGTKLIRPVFITIVLLTTLKLIYQNYF